MIWYLEIESFSYKLIALIAAKLRLIPISKQSNTIFAYMEWSEKLGQPVYLFISREIIANKL